MSVRFTSWSKKGSGGDLLKMLTLVQAQSVALRNRLHQAGVFVCVLALRLESSKQWKTGFSAPGRKSCSSVNIDEEAMREYLQDRGFHVAIDLRIHK